MLKQNPSELKEVSSIFYIRLTNNKTMWKSHVPILVSENVSWLIWEKSRKINFIHCNCSKRMLIQSPLISIKWSPLAPSYLQLPCEILIGSESSGKPAPAKCSSVKYSSKASDLIVVQLWGFTSSLHPVEDKQEFKHLLLNQSFKEPVKSRGSFPPQASHFTWGGMLCF